MRTSTFSMATQFTHLFWLNVSVENGIALKKYEILSEQIVQFDYRNNMMSIIYISKIYLM